MEVIPTIVPASFEDVRAASRRYAFAPAIHIDAGDGRFVPAATWIPAEGDVFPSSIPWEAHLMTEDPGAMGMRYAAAGASCIIAHLEAFADRATISSAFEAWKAAGARDVGLALKIETPLDDIAPYVPLCDTVTLMTIGSIGRQGIPFDPRGIERVAQLRATHPNLRIAVDGGISEKNIADLARAGATRFYIGSAFASSADPQVVYKRLSTIIETVQ